jgi:pimeloyl-ACP methyl ester carboxylesterase
LYSRVIRRIAVREHALEARWWPDEPRAQTEPIVLLHEGLGSVALWRDFPDALATATGRAVFAYSRRGHGASDRPAAPHTARFMHDEAIDWLPDVLDAAGIGRAILFGHSDGASIALVFGATFPKRTAALILEAPHVFVEDVAVASIVRMKREYETTNLRARLARYHADVDAAFHGWNDVWLAPEFREWNLEEYLPRVIAPALVIQGEQDEYGTLRQVAAIVRQVAGSVETLILPDCGHSPHRDQPERVIAVVAEFLTLREDPVPGRNDE